MPTSWELPSPADAVTNATRADLRTRPRAYSDVFLFQTPDGGEITFENGSLLLADGLYTAAYLSFFGGNEDDSGGESDDARQWWGNRSETRPSRKYRSETQYLLRSLPAVPSNLRLLEAAMQRDVAWMADENLITAFSALARIPALNRADLQAVFEVNGASQTFNFQEAWGVSK